MRLVPAGGQFVRDVCHVRSPLAEGLVHLLQALEIRMAILTRAADGPSLRSQAIVKLQYDFKDINQADAHLFSARVEHTPEIEAVSYACSVLQEKSIKLCGFIP